MCWARVWLCAALAAWPSVRAQDEPPPKAEPGYEDTFAGQVIELKDQNVTVSRTILGKTEKRTFQIKPDTRIEGKLRVKAKVTVGFVTDGDVDVARLIVVRS